MRYLQSFLFLALISSGVLRVDAAMIGYELRGPVSVIRDDGVLLSDLDGSELRIEVLFSPDGFGSVRALGTYQFNELNGDFVVRGDIAGQPLDISSDEKLNVSVRDDGVDSIRSNIPVSLPDQYLSRFFLENGVFNSARFELSDSSGAAITSLSEFTLPDGNAFDSAVVILEGSGNSAGDTALRFTLRADVAAIRVVPETTGISLPSIALFGAFLLSSRHARSEGVPLIVEN